MNKKPASVPDQRPTQPGPAPDITALRPLHIAVTRPGAPLQPGQARDITPTGRLLTFSPLNLPSPLHRPVTGLEIWFLHNDQCQPPGATIIITPSGDTLAVRPALPTARPQIEYRTGGDPDHVSPS